MTDYNSLFVMLGITFLAIVEISESRNRFIKVLTTSNPELANVTFEFGENDKKEPIFNLTVVYAYELPAMAATFFFAINKDKTDLNYEKVLVKTSINICKMLKGVTGDFLTKMILESLGKSSDISLKCPMQKMVRLTNFIIAEKFLPTFMISEKIKYVFETKMMGKVPVSKNMAHLLTVKIFGEMSSN